MWLIFTLQSGLKWLKNLSGLKPPNEQNIGLKVACFWYFKDFCDFFFACGSQFNSLCNNQSISMVWVEIQTTCSKKKTQWRRLVQSMTAINHMHCQKPYCCNYNVEPHISHKGERRARGYSEFGTFYPFFRDYREMCDFGVTYPKLGSIIQFFN